MGVHQTKSGITVIELLTQLGKILGYFVRTEEPMSPGDASSSELDVTWRRDRHARFPLFIFEVESTATKSSSDNAIKVFSRKTPSFEKPLFFFHLFLDASIGSRRVDYLKDNYDKLNYDAFLLSSGAERLRFITAIVEQHLRLSTLFDLSSVIVLLEEQDAFRVEVKDILNLLVERDYDHITGSDFLLTLELLIVERGYPDVRNYYPQYLNRYLADKRRVSQRYSYDVARSYSSVIHYALMLLVDQQVCRDEIFERLRHIEKNFQPWELWEPFFGLSQDHDMVLLSEFPIILTMLCAGFSPSEHAAYFAEKLLRILQEIRNFTHFNLYHFAEQSSGYSVFGVTS